MPAASRFRSSSSSSSRAMQGVATGITTLLLAAALNACGGSPGATERARGPSLIESSSPASQAVAAPAIASDSHASGRPSDRHDRPTSLGMIGSQTSQTQNADAPVPPPGSVVTPSLPRTSERVPATPSMVIRSGQASVQVDTLPRAIASIQRITASLGGYVGNTAIALGEDQVRRATIELKIPVTRYDDAVAGLTPLGKVESVNSSAEEVGEEFTDLTARITNAHRLESRLVALLAERTGKLQDALMVEHELARVREEIERYEGRIRFLAARVAMSTLTVNLHEPFPLVSQNPSESVLVSAAKDAWRNFVSLLALAISSLGVLLPVGAFGAAAHAIYRRRIASHPAISRPATDS